MNRLISHKNLTQPSVKKSDAHGFCNIGRACHINSRTQKYCNKSSCKCRHTYTHGPTILNPRSAADAYTLKINCFRSYSGNWRLKSVSSYHWFRFTWNSPIVSNKTMGPFPKPGTTTVSPFYLRQFLRQPLFSECMFLSANGASLIPTGSSVPSP